MAFTSKEKELKDRIIILEEAFKELYKHSIHSINRIETTIYNDKFIQIYRRINIPNLIID